MRVTLLALLVLLASPFTHAKEYGHYEPKRLLAVAETPTGKQYGFNLTYLDQMLNDLALHAKDYPPRFDTPQDRERAVRDVKTLSGMLDALTRGPDPRLDLLARAGFLNSMGHNLDIPGAAEKASTIFGKLLAAAPADPQGNYLYGTFLAGTGRPREALPYLEKSLAAGIAAASYSLGMVHLALGEKQKALDNLEAYRQRIPHDEKLARLIDAVRNGKVEIRRIPN